jgi:hypothetical protein
MATQPLGFGAYRPAAGTEPATADLDGLFDRLHLAHARRNWRDLVQRAERESWPYTDLLAMLAAGELAERDRLEGEGEVMDVFGRELAAVSEPAGEFVVYAKDSRAPRCARGTTER